MLGVMGIASKTRSYRKHIPSRVKLAPTESQDAGRKEIINENFI